MPEIEAAELGRVEYAESDVYTFPAGLPAFEERMRFVVLRPPHLAPLVFLVSPEPGPLRFICVPVKTVAPAYELRLGGEDAALVMQEDTAELELLAVLTFEEGRAPTANLLAPVVLNPARRLGVQAVAADSPYSVAHSLAGEVEA